MRRNAKGHAHAVKMTTGSLWKNILFFSLPLMLSQLLEVLFNLSDVAVAGKFADYKALGAVGSTTLLVSLFTGFLIGMGSGVNVCVAHRLGAGSEKGAAVTIHSSFVICTVTGLVLGAPSLCAAAAFPAAHEGGAYRRRGAVSENILPRYARHGDI